MDGGGGGWVGVCGGLGLGGGWGVEGVEGGDGGWCRQHTNENIRGWRWKYASNSILFELRYLEDIKNGWNKTPQIYHSFQSLMYVSNYTTDLLWIGSLLNRTWWRHQMETFSTSLALCAGNSPLAGEKGQWRGSCFLDLRLNKRLSKQSWVWWFETPLRSLWCHRNVYNAYIRWHYYQWYINNDTDQGRITFSVFVLFCFLFCFRDSGQSILGNINFEKYIGSWVMLPGFYGVKGFPSFHLSLWLWCTQTYRSLNKILVFP